MHYKIVSIWDPGKCSFILERYMSFIGGATVLIVLADLLTSSHEANMQPPIKLVLYLPHRTYNIQAISFTPSELVGEMKKYFPDMEVTYDPDERQAIGMYAAIVSV